MKRTIQPPIKPVCSLLILIIALGLTPARPLAAQTDADFLQRAVYLAQSLQRRTRIPSSVIIAQAVLETGWGRKPIATANNYFGMKASERPDGTINIGSVATGWTWAWTKEWDGTVYVDTRERFRTYARMADSFEDLGRLYTQSDRYTPALAYMDDPREFARQIAKGGYATAPDYARRLIQVMDSQNLYQYNLLHDDAEFVDQSDYPTVRPGESFEIYFALRNAGVDTWRAADGYYLRNLNEMPLGASPRSEPAEDVPPGDVVRWKLGLRAPAQPGVYRTAWQLRHGGQSVGPEMYIDVTVVPVEDSNQRTIMLWLGGLSLALVGAIAFAVHQAQKNPGKAPPA